MSLISLKHCFLIDFYANNDYASSNFLQWFVSEQVEEEANVEDILGQLRLIEGKGAGLFMLDREAKARPAPTVI